MTHGWGVFLAILLISSAAAADVAPPDPSVPPATSALNWSRLPGAENCIGVRELAAAVEERLGRSLFVSATQADVLVDGTIRPTSNPRGWHAEIRLSRADGSPLGTREIHKELPGCRDLDEFLALAIALMIDPKAADPRPPPPPPPITPPPQRPTPPVSTPPPVIRKKTAGPLQVKTSVGGTLGWGFLPGFGAGLLTRVAFERESMFGLEVDARFWPPQASAQSGLFWSAQGGFALCPFHGGQGATLFTGCAGPNVAMIHATFPELAEATGFRIDFTLQARLSRRIRGPLLIDLGGSLALPLVRPAFYRPRNIPVSYVAGSADVGISLQLP